MSGKGFVTIGVRRETRALVGYAKSLLAFMGVKKRRYEIVHEAVKAYVERLEEEARKKSILY